MNKNKWAIKIGRLKWKACKPTEDRVIDGVCNPDLLKKQIRDSFYYMTDLDHRIWLFKKWQKLIFGELIEREHFREFYLEMLEVLEDRMVGKLTHPLFGIKRKKFTKYISLKRKK